jgi:hypothetical protein
MYHPWQAHRAQAKFRGEEYTLEFEDFYEFWTGSWHERGRGGDDMILTRIDPEKPWQADNCKLRVRKEYLSEINKGKAGLGIRRTRGMDIHKRKTKGT